MAEGIVRRAAWAAVLFCLTQTVAACATLFPKPAATGAGRDAVAGTPAAVAIASDEVHMTGADVERVVIVADRVGRRFGMVATPALELAGYKGRDDTWSYRTLGYYPRGAAFGGTQTLAFAIVIRRKKDGSELLVAIDDLGRPKPPEFIRQLGRELRDGLAEAFSGYEINVRDRTWVASSASRAN